MSDTAAAGIGPAIEFEGEWYPLSPLTVAMVARISAFVAELAWRAVKKTRPFCTREEYAQRLDATTKLVNSGAYAWHTPRGQEAMQTFEGRAFELWLRMKVETPGVTLSTARKVLVADPEESLTKMAQADFDSNPGRGSRQSQETTPPASTPTAAAYPGLSTQAVATTAPSTWITCTRSSVGTPGSTGRGTWGGSPCTRSATSCSPPGTTRGRSSVCPTNSRR